jgi:hypothetical protein
MGRFKQQLTLQDRLSAWGKLLQEQANQLRPGPERDALVRKARQADVVRVKRNFAVIEGGKA